MAGTGETFGEALAGFDPARPVLVLTHHDADGLSAGAIFARAFDRVGREVRVRILGRGENPWSEAIREEFAGAAVGGLIVADLGLREGAVLPGVPTIVDRPPRAHRASAGGAARSSPASAPTLSRPPACSPTVAPPGMVDVGRRGSGSPPWG